MTKPTAPYNFVPLSSHIYRPDWASRISYDRPFKDGYCGYIDYRITTETEFLVGGASKPRDDDSRKPAEVFPYKLPVQGPLSQYDYAIPGSSIQGMLRNVLSIASFSAIQEVSERHFGVRDFNPKKGTPEQQDYQRLLKRIDYKKLEAAWLTKEPNDSDFPARLLMTEYRQLEPGESIGQHEKLVKMGPFGKKEPNRYAFDKKTSTPKNTIQVPAEVLQKFLDAHGDREVGSGKKRPWQNDSNKKKAFDQGQQVPVFACVKRGEIEHMGLSRLPIFASEHSVHQMVKYSNKQHIDPDSDKSLDLAECLFGTLRPWQKNGEDTPIKGLMKRVQCEPAVLKGPPPKTRCRTVVQSEPRPSFYPYYQIQSEDPANPGQLEQAATYNTWIADHQNGRIRGWKRYPARLGKKINEQPNADYKMATVLHTLPENSCFYGRIHFHNLTGVELGGLYWALTFGAGQQSTHPFRHSLGRGKPLGLGIVKLDILAQQLVPNSGGQVAEDGTGFMESFQRTMNDWASDQTLTKGWQNSKQIQLLQKMANHEFCAQLPAWYFEYPGDHSAYGTLKKQRRVLPEFGILPKPAGTPTGGPSGSGQSGPHKSGEHRQAGFRKPDNQGISPSKTLEVEDASLHHEWLTKTFAALPKVPGGRKIGDYLRSDDLFQSWSKIDGEKLKLEVFTEIKNYWGSVAGGWDNPSGKAKKIRNKYEDHLAEL